MRMKTKSLLFTLFALFFLAGGMGCEKKENQIIATGTLIYVPTGTYGFCIVKTHIIKTNKGDIDLFIDKNTIDAKPFENKDVTIYGYLLKQKHKQKEEFCPDLIEVKKISEN